jgi:hypothetical protein
LAVWAPRDQSRCGLGASFEQPVLTVCFGRNELLLPGYRTRRTSRISRHAVCVELDRLGERLHPVGDAGVEVSQRRVEAVDVAEQLGDEDTVVGEVEAARQCFLDRSNALTSWYSGGVGCERLRCRFGRR